MTRFAASILTIPNFSGRAVGKSTRITSSSTSAAAHARANTPCGSMIVSAMPKNTVLFRTRWYAESSACARPGDVDCPSVAGVSCTAYAMLAAEALPVAEVADQLVLRLVDDEDHVRDPGCDQVVQDELRDRLVAIVADDRVQLLGVGQPEPNPFAGGRNQTDCVGYHGIPLNASARAGLAVSRHPLDGEEPARKEPEQDARPEPSQADVVGERNDPVGEKRGDQGTCEAAYDADRVGAGETAHRARTQPEASRKISATNQKNASRPTRPVWATRSK